jgi:hypothetical protein
LPGADNSIVVLSHRWDGAFHHEYYSILTGNNIFQSAVRFIQGNIIYYASGHNFGMCSTNESDDGDVSLVIPIKGWWGAAYTVTMSTRNMAAPPVIKGFSGAFVFQAGVSATGNADYPAMCVSYVPDDGLWGAAAMFWGSWGVVKQGIWNPAGEFDMKGGPAVAYPISEPQMVNGIFQRIGSKTYFAKLFAYPQGSGGSTVGWEFVPVDDLPFDADYDTSDFETLVQQA